MADSDIYQNSLNMDDSDINENTTFSKKTLHGK